MTRLYGRAPRGRRLLAQAPFGHWKTTTFVAGLRRDGLTAPMVLDGPMTGEAFLAYVEQVLIPTLDPNDIVVMDNLPAHKTAPVRAAIAAAGAQLFLLPPYSPDMNRSKWLSPSSRRCSAKPRNAPLMASGDGSAPCSTDSLPVSAPTTSKPPAMATQSENALGGGPNPSPAKEVAYQPDQCLRGL